MNWDDTRFPTNQASSLLDLVVTNAPAKVDLIRYHPNPCSEHVIVTWNIKVTENIFKEQICVCLVAPETCVVSQFRSFLCTTKNFSNHRIRSKNPVHF